MAYPPVPSRSAAHSAGRDQSLTPPGLSGTGSCELVDDHPRRPAPRIVGVGAAGFPAVEGDVLAPEPEHPPGDLGVGDADVGVVDVVADLTGADIPGPVLVDDQHRRALGGVPRVIRAARAAAGDQVIPA